MPLTKDMPPKKNPKEWPFTLGFKSSWAPAYTERNTSDMPKPRLAPSKSGGKMEKGGGY